jgi:hypothetical protein
MQDLVAEYQQYQDATYVQVNAPPKRLLTHIFLTVPMTRSRSTRRSSSPRRRSRVLLLLVSPVVFSHFRVLERVLDV